MNIEFEATFMKIDKEAVRQKLKAVGARLIKSEFMQKRIVYLLPKGNEINGGWLRVRDEGDKITMSLKVVDGNEIHNQKEVMLEIGDFEEARVFLKSIGCREKAYQETKRELWELDGAEITLDEWPFLEPFVEVEGKSEEAVRVVAEKIGFDYKMAKFGAVDMLYSEKYGFDVDVINNQTPKLVFEMDNPFV